ncbi:MAG: hypothetical protein FJX64_11805 [Alphaproteobacteria bacterium]|nr:hypothetical protein [Alphaproteobacteria bacterium]
MNDAERKLTLRWIRTWAEAGPALEAIRRRELEAMTDAQAKAAALDLLSMPLPADQTPRPGSGLVEQQRWFARLQPTK